MKPPEGGSFYGYYNLFADQTFNHIMTKGDVARTEALGLLDELILTGGQLQYHGWEYERYKELVIHGPAPSKGKYYHDSETFEMHSLQELIMIQETFGYNSLENIVALQELYMYYHRQNIIVAYHLFHERFLVTEISILDSESILALYDFILLHDIRGEKEQVDEAWGRYYKAAIREHEDIFINQYQQKMTRQDHVKLLCDYAAYLRKHGDMKKAETMENRANELGPLINIYLDK